MAPATPKRLRGMTSWVPVDAESNFPIQNLPYGAFIPKGASDTHLGVAIGNKVLDLTACTNKGLFDSSIHLKSCFLQPTLNVFMGLGRDAWTEARQTITNLLDKGCPTIRDDTDLKSAVLLDQSNVDMVMPAQVGDYTDFYSSRYHATNVGIMFRGKDNALQPNWLHLPVGYHGRASSVQVSGTPVKRPHGQLRPDPNGPPVYDVCKLMDFELEMAFFVGTGNKAGEPIQMKDAKNHIFGLCLMNDWSARDIQKWEYVPLGPFNGKNLGTTISPWIVTLDALEPFLIDGETQDPTPLPYLQEQNKRVYDISLSVKIMPESSKDVYEVSRSNARHLYWSFQQQIVHHSSTGCNMRPGDLCGSGTISGPTEGSYGSMLEICWKGTKPLQLPDGTERKFLKDGDTVIMSGFCQGDGYRVGFGDVSSKVLPASK